MISQVLPSLLSPVRHRKARDVPSGPLGNAVDFIKPLQYVPTRTYERSRKFNAATTEFYGGMVEHLRSRMATAESIPECLVKHLVETQAEERLSEEDIILLAQVFAFGGMPSVRYIRLTWGTTY